MYKWRSFPASVVVVEIFVFVVELPLPVLSRVLLVQVLKLEELPSLPCDPILSDADLEAAFGTLCHLVIEAGFSDDESSIRVPRVLTERLDEDDLAMVLQEAKRLAAEFLISPAGRLLDGARKIDTEVPFLMRYERKGTEASIAGVIDLLADRGDESVIVDFKTDKLVREGEYFLQAAIYREAVFEWTGHPSRCYLLYLRNNTLIEVPEGPLPDLFSLTAKEDKQGENI